MLGAFAWPNAAAPPGRHSALPSSHRSRARPRLSAPASPRPSPPPATPSSIVIIPDNLPVPPDQTWYPWLAANLAHLCAPIVPLTTFPNPYDSNTKRWERVWLTHLRDAVDAATLLVAHGSGADAALRLLENARAAGAVLVCPTDEYHAGERHGRAYHWEDIRRNTRGRVRHVYCRPDGIVDEEESRAVGRMLGVESVCVEREGVKRMHGASEAPEVRALVEELWLNVVEDSAEWQ